MTRRVSYLVKREKGPTGYTGPSIDCITSRTKQFRLASFYMREAGAPVRGPYQLTIALAPRRGNAVVREGYHRAFVRMDSRAEFSACYLTKKGWANRRVQVTISQKKKTK